jgi:hypothetical protein
MITEFNKYNDVPKVGYHVIVHEPLNRTYDNKFVNFLNNNIGRIIEIIEYYDSETCYMITFDNIPPEFDYAFPFDTKTRAYHSKDIIIWSKNREEVETYITSKKYNI